MSFINFFSFSNKDCVYFYSGLWNTKKLSRKILLVSKLGFVHRVQLLCCFTIVLCVFYNCCYFAIVSCVFYNCYGASQSCRVF